MNQWKATFAVVCVTVGAVALLYLARWHDEEQMRLLSDLDEDPLPCILNRRIA